MNSGWVRAYRDGVMEGSSDAIICLPNVPLV